MPLAIVHIMRVLGACSMYILYNTVSLLVYTYIMRACVLNMRCKASGNVDVLQRL